MCLMHFLYNLSMFVRPELQKERLFLPFLRDMLFETVCFCRFTINDEFFARTGERCH